MNIKKLAKAILKKRYLITDEKLDEIIDVMYKEFEKELSNNIADNNKIEKEKLIKLEKDQQELEKKYNKLSIDYDIAKSKIKFFEMQLQAQSDLSSEIFK